MMKENIRLKHSLIFPILFIILIWTVKLYEISLNLKFYQLGIYPLSLKGTLGILTAPLIHADLKHLISNTFALLTLSIGLFYLYKKYAYQIFGLIYILTNILVWIFARNAFHIGASGIIYGLAAFLFFTGIFSKKKELMAAAMLVIFLYGGIIWGIFPNNPTTSWEAHLFGFVTGTILAIVFVKKIITQEPKIINHDNQYFYDFNNITCSQKIDFYYIYKNKETF